MTTTQVFEPANPEELLRGWLLHAHKGRDRHDIAARRCDGRRSAFGLPTIGLSALVGTAVFGSLGGQSGIWVTVGVGVLSATATVLSALQTFFDYAGRAERHRTAGAKYKAVIREIEEMLTQGSPAAMWDRASLDGLRQQLDALEEGAPVVSAADYDQIERRYTSVAFVREASALYR
jgi:hypothetical protein